MCRRALAIPPLSSGPYSHDRCRMYSADWAAALAAGRTTPDDEWAVVPCTSGWEYNRTDVPYSTIASEVADWAAALAAGRTTPDDEWAVVPCTSGWEYNRTDVPYSTIASEVADWAAALAAGRTTPDDEWAVVPCTSGWEYNRTDVPYSTIASEVGEVTPCPTRTYRALRNRLPPRAGVSRRRMYSADWAAALAAGRTTPDDEWAVVPCTSGWEYNRTDVPYSTIASEVADWAAALAAGRTTPDDEWAVVPCTSGWEYNRTDVPYSTIASEVADWAAALAAGRTTPDDEWAVVPCTSGWEYNRTDVPYSTIASELDWVCENDNLPATAQAIFFCGAIVGGLIFGWIADKYGRVSALVGTNLIGFVAGVGTAFCNSFWSFALCRFLVGFAFDNCFTMMYILVLEYVGPKWRTFVANMSIALFFTLAASLIPWIALWADDWRIFTLATSVPFALALATPYVVPESARWLVSQGKIDKALVILKKFERINKTKIPEKVLSDFTESSLKTLKENEAEDRTYSVLDLFRTPRLRRNSILLIIIWMAISLVFDGHVRNVGSLGLDIFLTFTIASATELPADTFLTAVLDRWGRRWLACGSMVVSGIFSLLATTVPVGGPSASLAIMGRFAVNISYNIGLQYCAELLPTVVRAQGVALIHIMGYVASIVAPAGHKPASVCPLLSLSGVSVNISYNIGLQYCAELLPTVVRAQGVALIHIMGYVASIVAPFVVYLANISQDLPLLILGALGVGGGLLCLLLPETMHADLPQTLADGESFGQHQRLWDNPCFSRPCTRTCRRRWPTGESFGQHQRLWDNPCFSRKPDQDEKDEEAQNPERYVKRSSISEPEAFTRSLPSAIGSRASIRASIRASTRGSMRRRERNENVA
ncbi:unnamed protein product [Plutella xylostella]|uniref:(diamondback moth) hypothetical protein n=1 Tax=Plutella xylostella TaxID=51655 RepID=A0A8S4G7Y9_PLUXY|nr:unnamed protein product [Plutella xylostella]